MTQLDPQARKRALMDRIQTEGIEAAFDAMLDVCKDKKAPAPARATAGTSLFRAAGLMNAKQDADEKSPENLTGPELTARIEKLRADRERLMAGAQFEDDHSEDDKPNDMFG